MADPNERRPMRLLDARRQADGELSDSDDEGEGGRRNHASHKERDTVATGRRAAVGIMSTGTTHGVGPSGAPSVAAPAATGAPAAATTGPVNASGTEQSDMEVDDAAPAQALVAKAKETTATPASSANGTAPGPSAAN